MTPIWIHLIEQLWKIKRFHQNQTTLGSLHYKVPLLISAILEQRSVFHAWIHGFEFY